MGEDIYDLSFSRNIGILTADEQQRLSHSTVAIAGLGGIGGNTLTTLARMGVGNFRAADFDRFDYANINRQYGAGVDTRGQLKCDVLADEVRRINPRAQIEIFSEGFTDENGSALLQGADLAIDAIDFYSIETHLKFHRETRERDLFTLMGSPVGFSACLQVFDPKGMSLEEYCDIKPDMSPLEKQLRYSCGLVPELAHIDYFDVSLGASNTDFLSRVGPSLGCACSLAASLVAAEAIMILLNRRKPLTIPHTCQFDPYTRRYEKTFIQGGMAEFDPSRTIARIPDKSSLVPQVLEFLFKKKKALKASVNGVELYYKIEGEKNSKTVLLISPLGGDAGFWARQTQELSRHFRTITFDNRGAGISTKCNGECSTELLADDAIALLDHLGVTRTHVVGLALGGLVAQHIAVKRPDLVESLVLASSYARADECIQDVTRQWRKVAMDEGMETLFDTCLEWLFSQQYIDDSQGELDKLKTFYRLTLQDPLSFRSQSLAGVAHDSLAILKQVHCPTLIIHGAADRLVDLELARRLNEELPDSRLLVLDEAPHFLIWEHATRFNEEVISFFSDGDASDGLNSLVVNEVVGEAGRPPGELLQAKGNRTRVNS
jgi:pimeloyl-ACP methyl ester carboxylesterase/molybdopterin/thiamine biosynthesis adenylyltransferase